MGKALAIKISVFSILVGLCGTSVIGLFAYRVFETETTSSLQDRSAANATHMAKKIESELQSISTKIRMLADGLEQEFKDPLEKLHYLKKYIAEDPRILTVCIYKTHLVIEKDSDQLPRPRKEWALDRIITRPEDDPDRIRTKDVEWLNGKQPLEYDKIKTGEVLLIPAQLADKKQILRIAVRLAEEKIMVSEIKLSWLNTDLAGSENGVFSFVTDTKGRLLGQSEAEHFTEGDNISHLPVLQLASTTEAGLGRIDYSETPSGILQYGAFVKIGSFGLVTVSQIPKTGVKVSIHKYLEDARSLAWVILLSVVTLSTLFGILVALAIRKETPKEPKVTPSHTDQPSDTEGPSLRVAEKEQPAEVEHDVLDDILGDHKK